MNLTILGTSNSIGPTSYVAHMARAEPGLGLRNLSIGQSSCLAGAYTASSQSFEGQDFVIVDFAVNDVTIFGNGFVSFDAIVRAYRYLLARIVADGAQPVCLLLPNQRYFAEAHPVREAHKAAAREFGAPYLDLAALLAEVCGGRSGDAAFRDAQHVNETVAGALAMALRAGLDSIAAAARTRAALAEVDRLTAIPLPPLVPPEQVVARRSSLRSGQVARLGVGDRVRLPGEPGRRLLGYLLNSSGSSGKAAFRALPDDGGAPHVKSLNLTVMDKREGRYTARFLETAAEPGFGSEGAEIEIVSFRVPVSEPTQFESAEPPESEFVELEGVLVAQAGETLRIEWSALDASFDLDLAPHPAFAALSGLLEGLIAGSAP